MRVNRHIPVIKNLCNHGYIKHRGDYKRGEHELVTSLLQCSEDARRMTIQHQEYHD